MHKMALIAPALLVALPGMALAQEATDTDSKEFPVTGNVPALCSGGTLSGGDSVFDLGVLTDTATGFLRTDLSAPDKVLNGAFCSSRSTVEIEATRLEAQNFTGTAPANFSRGVNYTATASGWTTTPASYNTGATSNPAATQARNTAFTGNIAVGISNFSTDGGSNLRLVADPEYHGLVTVTLTVAD
jgi:hypothetical protein